jgi:hypothetical protein
MPKRLNFLIATVMIIFHLNLLTTLVVLFHKVRSETNPTKQLAQYCAPPQDETDAPKLYCRNEDGASDMSTATTISKNYRSRALPISAINEALHYLFEENRTADFAARSPAPKRSCSVLFLSSPQMDDAADGPS